MELFSQERVLYISDDEVLSYKHGHLLYRNRNNVSQYVTIGNMVNKVQFIERIMRKEPRCATKVDKEHFIISFCGLILNYEITTNTIKIEHKFDKGMNNPLQFLNYFSKEDREQTVYYGEYIWNSNKGPVSIFKRNSGKWAKVYSFPANTITHIHNIFYDQYRNSFIILTGDKDFESGIWKADVDFKNVQPVLVGKQQYRSCVAFPVKDGIIYATDTPLEKNYIYHVIIDKDFNVKQITREFDLYGPCIYGCEYNNSFYFANSVEPDSSLSKWQYRFTYKLGEGVLDNASHLIKRNEDGEYEEIASVKKDILPMWLFQFGNILFPQNNSSHFYGVLQGCKQGHGVTVKFE